MLQTGVTCEASLHACTRLMSFLSLLVMVKVFCLGGRSLRCLLTKQVPKLHSVKEKETVGSTARPTRATGREGPFLIYEGGGGLDGGEDSHCSPNDGNTTHPPQLTSSCVV